MNTKLKGKKFDLAQLGKAIVDAASGGAAKPMPKAKRKPAGARRAD